MGIGSRLFLIIFISLGLGIFVSYIIAERDITDTFQKHIINELQNQASLIVEVGRQFGDLSIDIESHEVQVNNEQIDLTALEFRLLRQLVDRRGRVQSRDQLLSDVWGYSSEVTTRTVDTHIKRLREKLGPMGKYVQTIRGVGYKFSRSPE